MATRTLDAPNDGTAARILEVAFDTFAEEGFEGTTTRTVCERAKVNGAALNYHWGSKERLWHAVCERVSRDLQRVLASIDAKGAIDEVLVQVIDAFFDAFRRDPRLPRLAVWAALQARRLDYQATADVFAPIADAGKALLSSAKKRGELPADLDVEATLLLLYGQLVFAFVNGAGFRRQLGGDLSERSVQKRVRSVLHRSATHVLGLRKKKK